MIEELLEPSLHILQLQLPIHQEHSGLAIVVQSLVVGQHWLGLAVESGKSLRDHFLSIIQPPTGLAPVQQSLDHDLVTNFDVGQKDDRDILSNDFLPDIDVLLVAGKAIDHHDPSLAYLQDLLLELLHHDAAGHHLPFLHSLADLLGLLRARLQVLSQNVTH